MSRRNCFGDFDAQFLQFGEKITAKKSFSSAGTLRKQLFRLGAAGRSTSLYLQICQKGLGFFCCERRTWLCQKSAWNLEGFPEDHLSTGGVQAGSESVPHAQECPRKRSHPLVLVSLTHLDDARPQRVLEVLVLALHCAVGLLMVGWREDVLDAKGPHDVLVEVGHKGVAVVRHGHAGDPVPGRPLQESLATLL